MLIQTKARQVFVYLSTVFDHFFQLFIDLFLATNILIFFLSGGMMEEKKRRERQTRKRERE
jgi:hypothetical protein